MRRVYTDTSAFRAPFRSPNISFAGLGTALSPSGHAAYDINKWPAGRSYYSTHFYRAPYQAGYYQSNSLRGVADVASPAVLSAFGIGVLVGYLIGRASKK